MPPSKFKSADSTLEKEMKSITTIVTARSKALETAIGELQKLGLKAVPQILSAHKKHLTPDEVDLLKNATAEQIKKLIETHVFLKKYNSTMECI